MNRHLLLPGVALAFFFVTFMTGCDFLGLGSDEGIDGPSGSLRYQNFSHFEAERRVDLGDTTLTTSVTSRTNLLADGDTIAWSVAVSNSSGYLDVPVGRQVTVEAVSVPGDDVLASADLSLEQDAEYALYTLGYQPDITPVLLQEESTTEDEDAVPPIEGESEFRFLQGASTLAAVDIYINRPAEADSLEPEVADLEPAFSDIDYLDYTESVSYEVSRDPQSEMGNTLHIRMTAADDTTVVYDEELDFSPGVMQHIIIFDMDRNGEDDVLDIRLGRKNGDATMLEI